MDTRSLTNDGLGRLLPVHTTMAKLAATVRGTVAAFGTVSALIGADGSVPREWLVPALVGLNAWTVVYVHFAWRRGLLAPLIMVDLSVAGLLCLALGRLVPVPAALTGSNWVDNVASMTVICAQLCARPILSLAGAVPVIAAYLVGARAAGMTGGGANQAATMLTQAVLSAAVMMIAIRVGRAAAKAFDALQLSQTAAEVAAARRTDELGQMRTLHNGPLTTLTMAIHADTAKPTALLRRRAIANLASLPDLVTDQADERPRLVRLDERLVQVLVWYQHMLHLSTTLAVCSVPAHVADAFADATSEGLENVRRHSGVLAATVELVVIDGRVTVTISDGGSGFDGTTAASGPSFGLREVVIGRMRAVGGSGSIVSAPHSGCTVRLEWADADA